MQRGIKISLAENQMSIVVYVVDEDGVVHKELGLLEDSEVMHLSDIAKQKDLKCLPFLSPVADTYYNEKQAHQIIKELKILEKSDIASHVIDIIKKGAEETTRGLLLLKFEGE